MAERKKGIGASESAAVCGVKSFSCKWKVWLDKRGLLKPETRRDAVEITDIGHYLEPAIAKIFQDTTGERAVRLSEFAITWGDSPNEFSTLDYASDSGPLETKTSGTKTAQRFMPDRPPVEYWMQMQHQLACTDSESGHLAAILAGPVLRYVCYRIRRDERMIRWMRRCYREFWEQVESGEKPRFDYTQKTMEAVSRCLAADEVKSVELPSEAIRWDSVRNRLQDQIRELSKRKAVIDARIKAEMADAQIATVGGRELYSWSPDRNGTRRFSRKSIDLSDMSEVGK